MISELDDGTITFYSQGDFTDLCRGPHVPHTGFIKAIKGPQPWTNIMPTGGVSPDYDNLKKWFDAGAYCVGMGSQLMAKDEKGNFDITAIKQKTREAIAIIKRLRN